MTAMPLFQLGAVPVLVDVDSDAAVSLDQVEVLITDRTKALVVTNMWGLQDTRRLRAFLDPHEYVGRGDSTGLSTVGVCSRLVLHASLIRANACGRPEPRLS